MGNTVTSPDVDRFLKSADTKEMVENLKLDLNYATLGVHRVYRPENDTMAEITAAIVAAAASGEVIYLGPGTYYLNINLPNGGSPGFGIIGAGRNRTFLISAVANTPVFACQGLWYSYFRGLAFSHIARGAGTMPAVDIDGAVGVRGVQGNTWQDCSFSARGANDGLRGHSAFFMCRTAGNAGQGSENCFINCHFYAAEFACCAITGYNALNNQFYGGNVQDYTKHGLYFQAGSFHIYNMGFQSTVGITQIDNDGWDIWAFGGGVGDSVSVFGCRTESLRFMLGSGAQPPLIMNCLQYPAVLAWFPNYTYTAGTGFVYTDVNNNNNRTLYRALNTFTTGPTFAVTADMQEVPFNVVDSQTGKELNNNWYVGKVAIQGEPDNIGKEVNSNYNLTYRDRWIGVDCSAGNVTIGLYNAQEVPSGYEVAIVRLDNNPAYTCTVYAPYFDNLSSFEDKLYATPEGRSRTYRAIGGGIVARRWYRSSSRLDGTGVITEALGRQRDSGQLLMSKLINRSGDMVLQINGDSTGNASTEWVYQLAQKIGSTYPALAIDYRVWNTGSASYDLTAIQAGTAPSPGTVFLDNFNRTAADLFNTTPDVGAVWGRDGSNAAGDWSINGTQAVRTADTTSGNMLADGGVAGDIDLKITGTMSTAATGSTYNSQFTIKRLNSTNRITLTISVTSTGLVTWLIQKVVGGVTTTIAPSETLTALSSNTAGQAFSLSFKIVGLNVTATLNGTSVLSGTILQADADALAASTITGIGGSASSSMVIDQYKVDLTAATAPQKLSIYNCSIPGSNLSTQQFALSTYNPVAPDLMIISTGHNYGSNTPAQFETAIDSFLATHFALYPNAGVLITSQNPQKAPAANRISHYDRQVALKSYCVKRQIGYIPLFEKWCNEPNNGATLIETDGVHPTQGANSGSSFWANVVYNCLFDVDNYVDTEANLKLITPVNGELLISSDMNDIYRGNGTTLGGVLVQGGVRRFTGSAEATVVNGSPEPSPVFSIPISAGATYEISGVIGFNGDTDLLSNFIARGRASGTNLFQDAAFATRIGTALCDYMWTHDTSGKEVVDRTVWATVSASGPVDLVAETLNRAQGRCKFSFRITVATSASGNYDFRFYTRIAKVGTPTIIGSWDVTATRLS